jgi:hypothetical protein
MTKKLNRQKGEIKMVNVQPIETTYKGFVFRSRLEARYAVLFDHMGVEWHYEHEGYQTSSGLYLPDFWLPTAYLRGSQGVLFEIKPSNYSGDTHDQLREVALSLNVSGLLAKGFELNSYDQLSIYQLTPYWDDCIVPYRCTACRRTLFSYSGGSHYSACPHCGKTDTISLSMFDVFWAAYRVAVRYRFW